MSVKLLLPAAGRAVRMGGLLKELLPLGVRPSRNGHPPLPAPVLAWAVHVGLRAGAEAGLVVTSSAKAQTLMEVIASLGLPVPISYLHQQDANGLGAAVLCAEPHVREDDVVLLLMPDTVIWPPAVVEEAVRAVAEGAMVGAALFRVEHPERFGVAALDAAGRAVGFVDKPSAPASPWIWTAVAFRPDFFSYVRRSCNANEESGFTAALDLAAQDGAVEARRSIDGFYWDVGTYEGYVSALQALAGSGGIEELLGDLR